MVIDEAKKAVEELKAQGESDDEIISSFYNGYVEGKINIATFEALMQVLGYTLSDEFYANEAQIYEDEEELLREEPKEEPEEEKAMKLFGK